jgi:DNA transformation protein and related proteins
MKPISWLLEYFLQDCLDGDRTFTIKKMFGGYAIYKNHTIFALYAFDQIYFKTGLENRQDFIDAWSKQFSYEKKWKVQTICYYTLPEEIMENKEELWKWIQKSLIA